MGHCYRESTLRQLRILTSTGSLENELRSIVYSVSFTAHGLPNYNKEFPGEGFKARWISEIPDRKPDDPVILYLHGGGYALKTCQPQVTYICALARQLLPHRVNSNSSKLNLLNCSSGEEEPSSLFTFLNKGSVTVDSELSSNCLFSSALESNAFLVALTAVLTFPGGSRRD
ncbi:hypothetical protein FF38_05641 [Lucilia cuprina]|uniref:Uncharacterized protein n=1 Tax=Lucilia cuprina TaxID=7375 RepID=A0A0L0BRD5_LUCCU|nr:hypothetical protein FF38_05641 [Lucilia cuprina]